MQPECSISPQPVIKSGGPENADDGMVDVKDTEESALENKCECCLCPVEDDEEETHVSEESAPAKPLRSPSAPSRQEMLEHSLTHYPFRSWCPFCVMGKSKASNHSSTGGVEESEVPVVAFDYAFMNDRNVRHNEEDPKPENAGTEIDDGVMKILVSHDSKSKSCAAIPVPQKGIDSDEWAVREALKFLDYLGYQKLIIKSDQERALGAVLKRVRVYRGANTQNMTENSPVGSSQSNGMVERRIQSIEGQVRTLRCAFEARTNSKLPTSSCLFAWLVVHAGNILNLHEVGKDGKVPFQRLRGRRMHPELVEFGERVLYQPLTYKALGSAQPRWAEGVFVGIRMHTGEKLVATTEGVCKTRSIKRRIESERWDSTEISKVTGSPWKPYLYSDNDELLTQPPPPAIEKSDNENKSKPNADEQIVPRSFAILRKDLVNYGYTPSCPGCYAAANDRKHKAHTAVCRERIAKALSEDESQAHRISDAREREDAFLENAVREGDLSKGNEIDESVDMATPPNPVAPATVTPPTPVADTSEEVEQGHQRISHEDTIMEDDFYKEVDADQEMYADIESLPPDTSDMTSAIIGIVQQHVSEVWSQPRVTALATQYGLIPGSAYDIEVNDDNGEPWDFDKPEQRNKCIAEILTQRPTFLVGSPMCTAFSILQGLNKARMDPAKWELLWNKGVRHMLFAIKLYRIQAEAGRYFIHEHPSSASSWKLPEMQALMSDLGISKTNTHMCRFGMVSEDELGVGLVKKPTGFLTNSEYVKDQLSKTCQGGHRHVQLMGGRAQACQVYPEKLVRAILRGIKLEIKHSGIMSMVYQDLLTVSSEEADVYDYEGHFVDDMSGQILDTRLVIAARKEEMATYYSHNAYEKRPITECWHVTGKAPIGCRWIDINKGDDEHPEYRSRLVAKEINRSPSDEMFAATPPLEAKKMLFSMAMSNFANGRARKFEGTQKLLFIDVKRAYFYAPARRSVYVSLPDEDPMPGYCAKLNVSMYGTRDAASNWEEKYASHLIKCGFTQGKSSPCVFYHEGRGIRLVVHGDDFTFLGNDVSLDWCTTIMQEEYDIKIRGRLGPDKNDQKSIRILNRCLEWRHDGLYYEADPRHAEIIVDQMNVANNPSVVTPGIKSSPLPEEEDVALKPEYATKFRRVVARANFLSQDRMDIQYAVKEAARGMAIPRQSDWDKLLRIAKYLVGRPRYVIKYAIQNHVYSLNCFGDSDFAGDVVTRKSTSGGIMCLGDHAIKTWSTTQSVIALSTGEAELYAINRTAAIGMGGQSILCDLGVELDLRVFTDATTGKSLASRRGLGKVRHIAVNELWLQSHVHDKSVVLVKIKNKFNPSDMLTKYLTKAEIQQIMEHVEHYFESGRSEVAPKLVSKEKAPLQGA